MFMSFEIHNYLKAILELLKVTLILNRVMPLTAWVILQFIALSQALIFSRHQPPKRGMVGDSYAERRRSSLVVLLSGAPTCQNRIRERADPIIYSISGLLATLRIDPIIVLRVD